MASALSGLRIVRVTSTWPTGSGRAVQVYSHALRELGAEVEVWSFSQGAEVLAELATAGFPVRRLGLRKHAYRLSTTRALTEALAEDPPDWVHAHHYEVVVHASRAKLAGAAKALIVNHHDSRLRWSRRIMAWPYRRVPDVVIAPSPSAARHLGAWYGYPPDRVVALPHRIVDDLIPSPGRNEALAEELGLTGAYPVVMWIARLQAQKGHVDLLRAFQTIVKQYPEARLVLVGDGKLTGYLQKLAGRLGLAEHVVFAGRRDDVQELLVLADVFVCPSHAECCCNAVVEAMAAGRPIVSTNVWGSCDYITDGESGLLVGIGQPRALAEAIHRMASDRHFAQQLGQAARAAAQQHFSMAQLVAGLEEIYTKAIRQQELQRSHGR